MLLQYQSVHASGACRERFFSVRRASPIDAIYAFGDSLSDVGNIYAYSSVNTPPAFPAAPYVNGQFSNGNVLGTGFGGGSPDWVR